MAQLGTNTSDIGPVDNGDTGGGVAQRMGMKVKETVSQTESVKGKARRMGNVMLVTFDEMIKARMSEARQNNE